MHLNKRQNPIDKSGANNAALEALKEETGQAIEIRQIKYLNNPVEQDDRTIKRIVRPMLGFNTFDSARCTLCGIELMHMIKKGQMIADGGKKLSAAGQFYSLAAENPARVANLRSKEINATEPIKEQLEMGLFVRKHACFFDGFDYGPGMGIGS